VVAAAERVTRRPVPLRIAGRRRGDPAVLVASSTRARQELGWAPQLQNIDEIVASAWRWMERRAGRTLA
jgi:UDP-glucose 4-epimerase